MGTDIWVHAEYLNFRRKKYQYINKHFYIIRSYLLFDILAGGRGRREPIYCQRGLPDNVSAKTLKDYRNVFYSLLLGVLIKIIMNISLLRTCVSFGFPAYYGFITATILGYVASTIFCLMVLYYKYNVPFEEVLKQFVDILCGSLIMVLVLLVFKLFVPIESSARMMNLLIIFFYALIGAGVYFFYAYQSKLTKNVFGGHFLKSITKVFFRR